MSCSTCVTSLAGFGQDDVVEASPEVLSGIKTGIASFIGGPIIGSFAGLATGAIAWKDHRVLGGVLGFFGGGILGSVVGLWLAKRAIVNDVLPGLEQMSEEIVSGATYSIGPNSAGPSEWTQPLPLPSGGTLPTELLGSLVSQAIGGQRSSSIVQAATSAVSLITKVAVPTTPVASLVTSVRLPTLVGSAIQSKTPVLAQPSNVPVRSTAPILPTPTNVPKSTYPVLTAPTSVPVRSTTPVLPTPTNVPRSTSTSDASIKLTKLLPGQTMPMPDLSR